MDNSKKETSDSFNKIKTPTGFGKDVNDYLNHYVTIADAKAGAILATNLIFFGVLIDIEMDDCLTCWLFFATGILLCVSIFFCGLILYPRLFKGGQGFIFWENINAYKKIEDYTSKISSIDDKEVEIEYAKQNWYVSKLLSKKNKYIRISLWISIVAIIFLSITYLNSL